MRVALRLLLVCAVVMGMGGLRAAGAEPPVLRIPRVDAPPSIDMVLSGATPPGVLVDAFVQREPGDGVPASQPTRAYLSYDEQHLYVVFVCESSEPVRANLTRRENIMSDDVVGLILDTYHDGRRAYMFLTNPLGIQLDGVTVEGQDDDYSFDALWRSEGRVTGNGFVVLIAIPFKSLRFRNALEQQWGVALGRIIPRATETSFWPYITRRINSFGKQMATLDGVQSVSPGRNLQAIPYGSFASARYLDEESGERLSDSTGRVGLDGKAVLKDTVTVDLTANPDFSQVESDEPQVTVNQRFEVYFPEKRPFFIENASYFETPQNLFFSRRIADPDFGVRVTAKSRGWAVGTLLVNDDLPGERVAPADPRYEAFTGIGVARVAREFANRFYVGGLFTDREFGDTGNRVFGGDARWRIDDSWAVTGQWVGSHTTALGGEDTTGSSAYASLVRSGRSFNYEGDFTARSPDFRADLGFIPRVDMLATEHETRYRWHTKGKVLLNYGPEVEGSAIWDYAGALQEWTIEPAFDVELAGQTQLGVRHWETFERFEGIDFRHRTSAVYGETQWWSWFTASVFARWGTGINYYPAPGLPPFLADMQEVESGVTLRPTPRLRLDETYIFARLSSRDGTVLPTGAAEGDIFNNHILRSRVNYQFTRPLSARVIFDYEAVLPNESLVSLERTKRFAADVLVTYLVNPWTALYVGYTDAYANLERAPGLSPPWVRGGAPTTSVGRQVFVKVSYLFRY